LVIYFLRNSQSAAKPNIPKGEVMIVSRFIMGILAHFGVRLKAEEWMEDYNHHGPPSGAQPQSIGGILGGNCNMKNQLYNGLKSGEPKHTESPTARPL
jgi:hypothetical protein